MIFRQLFDEATSTFTYLIADEVTREALLIDTVFEQHLRDLALLRELGLTLRFCVETHVHADHVTGGWLMRDATECELVLGKASGAAGADRLLSDGDTLKVGALTLSALSTPGHTDGCMSYLLADEGMVFTGDALLIRGAGRTDFQQGNAAQLFHSVREKLFSLPPQTRIYPGHDYSGRSMTTVAEERQHNPRLGDHVREEDFVGYMDNLGLPHPKRMDHAVPANLRCGKPEGGDHAPKTPDWGPVVRTFAGVLQVEPEWVFTERTALQLVDVRETAEVEASPLPKLPDALALPLSRLREELGTIPKERPVILLCPAGARSARAAQILEGAGFPQVANMRGGLLAWLKLGLPFDSAPRQRG